MKKAGCLFLILMLLAVSLPGAWGDTASGGRKGGCPYSATGEHDWGGWETVREATCSEEGVRECVCRNCGSRQTMKTQQTAHVWGEWSVVTKPTNYYAGVQEHQCSVCLVTEETALYPSGTLVRGEKGEAVAELQEKLDRYGFNCGKSDGEYGKKTEAAVKAAEAALFMEQDGIAWPFLTEKLGQDQTAVHDMSYGVLQVWEESVPANGESYVEGETVTYGLRAFNTLSGIAWPMLDVRIVDAGVGEVAAYEYIACGGSVETAYDYVVTKEDVEWGSIKKSFTMTWDEGGFLKGDDTFHGSVTSENVTVYTAPGEREKAVQVSALRAVSGTSDTMNIESYDLTLWVQRVNQSGTIRAGREVGFICVVVNGGGEEVTDLVIHANYGFYSSEDVPVGSLPAGGDRTETVLYTMDGQDYLYWWDMVCMKTFSPSFTITGRTESGQIATSGTVVVNVPMYGRQSDWQKGTIKGLELTVCNTGRMENESGELEVTFAWTVTNTTDKDVSDWAIVCDCPDGQELFAGGLSGETLSAGATVSGTWRDTVPAGGRGWENSEGMLSYSLRAYGYTDDDICVRSASVKTEFPSAGVAGSDLSYAVIELWEAGRPANGDFYVEGESILFGYRVSCTQRESALPMLSVKAEDTLHQGVIASFDAIGVESKKEFTASYTVTKEDVEKGSIENTASISWRVELPGTGKETTGIAASDPLTVYTVPRSEEDDYYTLTFDMAVWEARPSMMVRKNETGYTLPVPEEKDGYEFTGWCVISSKGNEPNARANRNVRAFSTGEAITANLTLQAQYRQTKGYTVTLDAGEDHRIDGTKSRTGTVKTMPDGRVVSYPAAVSSKKGENFEGWYTADGVRVDDKKEYVFKENTTLYAQWSANASVTIKGK